MLYADRIIPAGSLLAFVNTERWSVVLLDIHEPHAHDASARHLVTRPGT